MEVIVRSARCLTIMAPLITIFLLPDICPSFILAQVIPIPEASIPDSEIVTAAPTVTMPATAPPGVIENPAPTTPFVPDNVNAILLSDYSYIYTMVSSLPDGIVMV